LDEAREQERRQQQANKAIGSGRSADLQGQTKPLKPLPMFDSQNPGSNGSSSWNPLNSSNLFENQVEQKARLPVFSTLSK